MLACSSVQRDLVTLEDIRPDVRRVIVSGLARLSRCRLPEPSRAQTSRVRNSRSAAVFRLDFPPLGDFNGRKGSYIRRQLGPVQPGKVKPDLSEPELSAQTLTSSCERRQSGGIPALRGSAEGPGGGGGAIPAPVICLWWVSVEWDALPYNDPPTS